MDYGEATKVDTPCIEWSGYRNKDGYGKKSYKGKSRFVHRVEWIEANGPIPDGLNVLHKCDNRACYRLDHLFLGTQRQNVLDMFAKGRGNRRIGPNPAAAHHGEDNCKAKLNWKIVREIREAHKISPIYGSVTREYADKYGVLVEAIRAVVTNKTWRE